MPDCDDGFGRHPDSKPRSLEEILADTEFSVVCGAPLTDFVIDAGICQRPVGHRGIHWFNDNVDRKRNNKHE